MKNLVFLTKDLFDNMTDTGVGSCNVGYVLLKKDEEYKVAHIEVKDRWENTISSKEFQEQAKKQFPEYVIICTGKVEIQKRDTYPGPSNLTFCKLGLGDNYISIENQVEAARIFSQTAKESFWGFHPEINMKQCLFSN